MFSRVLLHWVEQICYSYVEDIYLRKDDTFVPPIRLRVCVLSLPVPVRKPILAVCSLSLYAILYGGVGDTSLCKYPRSDNILKRSVVTCKLTGKRFSAPSTQMAIGHTWTGSQHMGETITNMNIASGLGVIVNLGARGTSMPTINDANHKKARN